MTPSRPVYRIRQRASGLFTDINETARAARFFSGALGANRDRSFFSKLRGDIFGGTIAALISLPYGMALSLAIGLSPESGLYTSIIGSAISGLLSGSPAMIGGLSATAVPVLAPVVKTYGVGAALAVGCLSGVLMILIGWLRLGRFAKFLPPSIVSAFTCGLGLVICTAQLKSVFGVKPVDIGFDLGIVDDVVGVALALPRLDSHALLIAGVVAATMLLLPRWRANVPSSLVGVVFAAVIAYLLGFTAEQRIGTLPSGFPALRALDLSGASFAALLHPALTLAGLFTINQVLTGIVIEKAENRPSGSLDGNRELIAQGAANVVLPFFGSPPGVAMLARSVASVRAGAVSRLSIFAHCLVLLLLIIPLRGMIELIPLAALAAVTVMVGLQLVDWKRLASLRKMTRTDLTLFLLTFALVVLSDLIIGVGVGFLVAMLLFIENSASSAHLEEVTPPDPEAPDYRGGGGSNTNGDVVAEAPPPIRVFRLVGPLFFASSEKIYNQLDKEVRTSRLELDLSAAGLVDSASTEFLRNVYRLQKARGGELFLSGVGKQHLFLFAKGGLLDELGAHCFDFDARVAATNNITTTAGSTTSPSFAAHHATAAAKKGSSSSNNGGGGGAGVIGHDAHHQQPPQQQRRAG